MIRTFLDSQAGATAIEYGLIAALIGLAVLAAGAPLSDSMVSMWDYITQGVSTGKTPE